MLVRELELKDVLSADPMSLRMSLRSEQPVAYVVKYKRFQASTLLTSAPANHIWRFSWVKSLPFLDWFFDWERLLDRELIDNKRLMAELRASHLKKSAPEDYWVVGGDNYEDSGRVMLAHGVWYDNWCIPTSMVDLVVAFQERWIRQLGAFCFTQKQDEEVFREIQQGMAATDLHVDSEWQEWNMLFGYGALSPPNLYGWLGDDGLISRLQRTVERLESGKKDFVIQEIERDNLRLRFDIRDDICSGYWSWLPDGKPSHVTLESFDLIFAYRARVTRLLKLPQYYYYVKDMVARAEATAVKHPISAGLPYHPLEELRAYLRDMEAKYPILIEEPFPKQNFPTTLD